VLEIRKQSGKPPDVLLFIIDTRSEYIYIYIYINTHTQATRLKNTLSFVAVIAVLRIFYSAIVSRTKRTKKTIFRFGNPDCRIIVLYVAIVPRPEGECRIRWRHVGTTALPENRIDHVFFNKRSSSRHTLRERHDLNKSRTRSIKR